VEEVHLKKDTYSRASHPLVEDCMMANPVEVGHYMMERVFVAYFEVRRRMKVIVMVGLDGVGRAHDCNSGSVKGGSVVVGDFRWVDHYRNLE
jgi:hypothetical protein